MAAAVKREWPTQKESVIAGIAEATKYLWSTALEKSFVLGAGALAIELEAEATAAAAKAAAMMAVAVAALALAAMTASRVTFERAWSGEHCHHEARCRMLHTAAAAAAATAANEARHGCWLVVLCSEGTPPTRLAGAGAT